MFTVKAGEETDPVKIILTIELDLEGPEPREALPLHWLERVPNTVFDLLHKTPFYLSDAPDAEPFRYHGGGSFKARVIDEDS